MVNLFIAFWCFVGAFVSFVAVVLVQYLGSNPYGKFEGDYIDDTEDTQR